MVVSWNEDINILDRRTFIVVDSTVREDHNKGGDDTDPSLIRRIHVTMDCVGQGVSSRFSAVHLVMGGLL